MIERRDSERESNQGPAKLVYKRYGGNTYGENSILNSPMVQSVIFYEQSKRGWGPKLYGLFDGGRIEEFIECRTLQYEEAFIPEISRDVARAYARFHSIKLPFSQKPREAMLRLMGRSKGGKEELANVLESGVITDSQVSSSFKRLINFPFAVEIDWILSVYDRINQRAVLVTFDPNYMNRLVRNERPSDPNVTRSIIIDYDFTAYSYRGYDLGGHFVNRCFNWASKESKVTNVRYPDETERITFLSSYLQECERHFDDLDRNSLDSLENVTLEADLHAFVYMIVLLGFGLVVHRSMQEQPKMFTFISPMLDLYQALKLEFVKKYPSFALNEQNS